MATREFQVFSSKKNTTRARNKSHGIKKDLLIGEFCREDKENNLTGTSSNVQVRVAESCLYSCSSG
jgi:hypothetical protein